LLLCFFPCAVNDCYEIGRLAYLKSDHYHTVLWMREALRLLDMSPAAHESDELRANILDHLSFSTYMVKAEITL
jgi:prolyl 4-hydroxylase